MNKLRRSTNLRPSLILKTERNFLFYFSSLFVDESLYFRDTGLNFAESDIDVAQECAEIKTRTTLNKNELYRQLIRSRNNSTWIIQVYMLMNYMMSLDSEKEKYSKPPDTWSYSFRSITKVIQKRATTNHHMQELKRNLSRHILSQISVNNQQYHEKADTEHFFYSMLSSTLHILKH